MGNVRGSPQVLQGPLYAAGPIRVTRLEQHKWAMLSPKRGCCGREGRTPEDQADKGRIGR